MDRFNGIHAIGFGTYPLSGAEVERCVTAALDVGIRHIDTAQMYGNEKHVGRAIAGSGVARGDIFLVTKVAKEEDARFIEHLGFEQLGVTIDGAIRTYILNELRMPRTRQ